MKQLIKTALFVLAAFVLPPKANAQVIIISEDYFKPTSYKLNTEVIDSLTNEPISFASVYLMHKNDTLITNFSLTDTLGKAELKDITRGDYNIFVEYLGYKTYTKSLYINKDRTLPTIRMHQDQKQLNAAKVSAVGELIEFKQDTVIYNATLF